MYNARHSTYSTYFLDHDVEPPISYKEYMTPDAANEIQAVHDYVRALAAFDIVSPTPAHAAAAFDLYASDAPTAAQGLQDWAAFLSPAQAHVHATVQEVPVSWNLLNDIAFRNLVEDVDMTDFEADETLEALWHGIFGNAEAPSPLWHGALHVVVEEGDEEEPEWTEEGVERVKDSNDQNPSTVAQLRRRRSSPGSFSAGASCCDDADSSTRANNISAFPSNASSASTPTKSTHVQGAYPATGARTLWDYGVAAGDTLWLTWRLPGGAPKTAGRAASSSGRTKQRVKQRTFAKAVPPVPLRGRSGSVLKRRPASRAASESTDRDLQLSSLETLALDASTA